MNDLTFNRVPEFNLPDFVKDVIEVKGPSTPNYTRIFPRNTPEILINLADPIKAEIGSQSPVVEKTTIQGSKTDYVDVYHPGNCHFISVRFTTNSFYKILGIPQKSFTNNFPRLDYVVDTNVDHMIKSLREACSTESRFHILCRWLNEYIQRRNPPSQLVSDFIITQLRQKPHLSVGQLAELTGYTRKHLGRRFKEEAGLTIKEYQKINRLRRVRESISEREHVHWAEVACEHGFYDQSHLIRDFKRYTGHTPTDYLNRRDLVDA